MSTLTRNKDISYRAGNTLLGYKEISVNFAQGNKHFLFYVPQKFLNVEHDGTYSSSWA